MKKVHFSEFGRGLTECGTRGITRYTDSYSAFAAYVVAGEACKRCEHDFVDFFGGGSAIEFAKIS